MSDTSLKEEAHLMDSTVEIMGREGRKKTVRYRAPGPDAAAHWRPVLAAAEGEGSYTETANAQVRMIADFPVAVGLKEGDLPAFELFQFARAILRPPPTLEHREIDA